MFEISGPLPGNIRLFTASSLVRTGLNLDGAKGLRELQLVGA